MKISKEENYMTNCYKTRRYCLAETNLNEHILC